MKSNLPRHFSYGLLMGSADIIPGVSGGTMALIVGIYRRLIAAIAGVVDAVTLAARGRFGESWSQIKAVEWSLVLPLLAGILLAIKLGALFIPHLLQTYPVQCRALFFGLVAGSLMIPWRERHTHRASHYGLLVVGAVVAFVLTGLPRGANVADPSYARVFMSAAVAINAMILPGVSGAFLLEVLGLYTPTLTALNALNIPYILVFVAGAGIGLGAFARLLGYLLEHQHDVTMAVLVGLLAGSLRALWPWVEFVEHLGSDGVVERVPNPAVLLPPDSLWPIALGLALAGFAFVVMLAQIERRRISQGDEVLAERL